MSICPLNSKNWTMLCSLSGFPGRDHEQSHEQTPPTASPISVSTSSFLPTPPPPQRFRIWLCFTIQQQASKPQSPCSNSGCSPPWAGCAPFSLERVRSFLFLKIFSSSGINFSLSFYCVTDQTLEASKHLLLV